MTRRTGAVIVASLLIGAGFPASPAAAKPKSYKTCAALNRDYPHGVGRKGARDRTSDERVTNFRRSNRLYAANDGKGGSPPFEYDLDRDNDGIACEQL